MKDTITLLKECNALLEGHFLYSSGRHGDKYFQCAKLLEYPDRAAAALSGLAKELKDAIKKGSLKIDLIAGPAMGGILVAYELGRQLGLPAVFTERDEGGIMTLRRGFEIKPGQKILIAEDVVTTGKSSGECAKALSDMGAEVTALACIVDRRGDIQELPWQFFAACRVEAENWDKDDCKLCKKGIPLVKPGSRRIT